MVFEPNTLILVNYTAMVKETGDVIETTLESDAKNSGTFDPTRKYEPRLVSVGEGWVLKGFDEALQTSSVAEQITVDVAPGKGFGERDPSKVRMMPLRRLGERAEELRVGDEVEVDNRIGIVRFTGSGRAQIDFNHKLAGKTVSYKAEVVKQLETDDEKTRALIRRRLPVDEDKLVFKAEGSDLTIEIPVDFQLLEGLQVIKRAISADIFKFVKNI